MNKNLSALEKLKGQVKPLYHFTFDFESCEIEENIIQEIVKKEEIIFKTFRSFRSYSQNIFEICKELYEVYL